MAKINCKTKYEAVFEELRRRITSSPPGMRLPTVRGLMAEFNASQSTIDRTLGILESQKLIIRKNGHGIFCAMPSANITLQEPLRITIAASDYPTFITEMFLNALSKKFNEAGHFVQIVRFDWRDRIIRSIPNKSCDALLIVSLGMEVTLSDILRLSTFKVPVLLLDRVIHDSSADFICTDNIHGGALAAMHFFRLGHHNTAVFIGESRNRAIDDRVSGFVRQCVLLGMPAPQIIDCEVKNGEFSAEASFHFAAKAIADGRFSASAYFCVTDGAAMGLLHALYEAEIKVPQTVSVIGFNGVPDCAISNPALTSIVHDFDSIATHALEYVINKVANPNDHKLFQQIIPPILVEKKSTAPYKGK